MKPLQILTRRRQRGPVKTIALSGLLLASLCLVSGCSDDDDPTTPETGPDNTDVTTWDEDGQFWRSQIDATSETEFARFSFADRDIVGNPRGLGADWDIAFRRDEIQLNGGASGPGTAEGAILAGREFASVTTADVADATWQPDAIDYSVDEWYIYDPVQNQLNMTQNVYSMVDASGDHYVKFRIDRLEGTSRTSMGTVHITYFFQTNPNDLALGGTVETAAIEAGEGTAYFDFSSGSIVSPTEPSASLDWDIAFGSFNVALNGGPNGAGGCAAFPAFGELDDPTEIEAFTSQPVGAPLFPDVVGSALTDWYDYNPQVHQLSAKDQCYLIRDGEKTYKLRIESYYSDVGGQPLAATYRFIWAEL